MKKYDICSNINDYKIGEVYLFLYTDPVDRKIIHKKRGSIAGTGTSLDGVKYVEVDIEGMNKKYAVTSLSRTLYNDFYKNMDKIPDPNLLGEVTIVKKTTPAAAGAGEVRRVTGLPGDVKKVPGSKENFTGEVTRVKK